MHLNDGETCKDGTDDSVGGLHFLYHIPKTKEESKILQYANMDYATTKNISLKKE